MFSLMKAIGRTVGPRDHFLMDSGNMFHTSVEGFEAMVYSRLSHLAVMSLIIGLCPAVLGETWVLEESRPRKAWPEVSSIHIYIYTCICT